MILQKMKISTFLFMFYFSSVLLSYINIVQSSTIHVQKRYTQEDVCHNTTPTLRRVENCPNDRELLFERSQKKQCHTHLPCNGKPLEFHCVRYQNGFAEVCAPKESITGFCCPEFDEGLGRIREDYSAECSACPYQYNSTETSLFSECFPCKQQKSTKSGDVKKRSVHVNVCENSENKNELNTLPVYVLVIAIYIAIVLSTGIISGILLFIRHKYNKCLLFKKTTVSQPQNEKDDVNVLNKESSSKLLEKSQRSPSFSEI